MSHKPDATVGVSGRGLGESLEKEAVLVMFWSNLAERLWPRYNDQIVGPAGGAFLGASFAKTQGLGSFTGTSCRSRWDESCRTAQGDDGDTALG